MENALYTAAASGLRVEAIGKLQGAATVYICAPGRERERYADRAGGRGRDEKGGELHGEREKETGKQIQRERERKAVTDRAVD